MWDYERVFNRLVDDESRICFEARKAFLTDQSLSCFYSILRKKNTLYRFRLLSQINCAGIVLWGEEDDRTHYHTLLLQDAGYKVVGPCISFEECLDLVHKHGFIILVPRQFRDAIPLQVPTDRIVCVDDHLVGRCGWQYFDYFLPESRECFLDGGALDGSTTTQFIQWCNGEYEHIYAFEPNPLQKNICQANLQMIGNPSISFYVLALWNENTTLQFEAFTHSKWDAHVSAQGQYSVSAATADSILDGKRITFLKLDVEGAELHALEGAKQTILQFRPRMAISVYHNPDDFVRIPLYLSSLVPDYRFALRHYHSDLIETILYVF